jgi:hypothetical protein
VEYRFILDLPASELLRFYRGRARRVQVRTTTGTLLEFPAELLRRFVTVDGVQGLFVLRADADNRALGIERVG